MAMAKRLLLGFWTVVAGAVLACALLPATALAADVELAVTYNDNAEGAMDTAIADALAAQGAPAKATVTVIKVTGAATDITDGNWEALRACFTADSGWDALKYLNFRVMPNIESVGFTSSASTSEPSKLVKASFSWDGAQPKTIGNHAFRNCANLYDISFGNIVETIGDGAFYGCKTLTLSDLPDSVKSIGKEAFRGCKSLRLSEMPDNAETVSDGAFQGCTDLKRMKFPAKVKTIGSRAFDIAYSDGTSHYLTQLTFVGAAPTSVAADAFGSYSAGMLICEEGNASGFDEEWMKSAFGDNASNWSVNVSNWPFTVRGGVKDQDWSWSDNNTVLTIRTATPVIVGGVATALNTIEVKNVRIVVDCGEGETADVTLSSVNINTDKGSALQVASGALDLKLETAFIAANNPVNLVSSNGAGIEHGTNPLKLSVAGTGSSGEKITIESSKGGAGIGGVDADGRRDAGNFALSSGADKAVTVKGAPGCAGIGGAEGGSATNLSFTESSAPLNVIGGAGAAGIGGGEGGSASDIKFTAGKGHTVTATGGGAAIGGGKGGNASDLLFDNDNDNVTYTFTATGGGAAIGSGTSGTASNLRFKQGTYKLTADNGGAGVGAGAGGSASGIVIEEGHNGIRPTSCSFNVTTAPAFSSGTTITAGLFKEGNISANTVYGIQAAEGCKVVDSGESRYPYQVASTKNPFVVAGGTEGTDWSYDIGKKLLKVLTTTPLDISMAEDVVSTNARIQVECPESTDTARLTINGLKVKSVFDDPALGVKKGRLDLELVGDNVLDSRLSCGLGNAVDAENKLVLTVSGEGSLVAKGSDASAGIGGNWRKGCKSFESITIKDGTITATGSHCGIGGGGEGPESGTGEGGTIVIEGGTVTAEGYGAQGIGSGSTSAPATVVITGGKVTAKGTTAAIDAGAEISGGYFGVGDATAQTVYGITPQADFKVWANEGADAAVYPFYVAKTSALKLKQGVEKTYDGKAFAADDVLEAASYGTTDAKADVTFSYRAKGTQDAPTAGLPANEGTWEVTATLPAKTVGGEPYAAATATAEVTVKAAFVYPVVEGDKGTWNKDGSDGMRFKIDASLDKFLDVAVDGTRLTAGKDYDATAGSTVIVLRPTYLAGLAAGEHTLDVTFTDGSSTAVFTIEGAPAPKPLPEGGGDETGGASLVAVGDPLGFAAGAVLTLAAFAVGGLALARRRG
ncbi:leucine-rich repeat domain-containing protein [Raoultibacter phocaeensis]|uniref:leucine-rich repeat domain-containing protein n=1 Tax=Raoultibacter phocaeensis TaxID=2479841 RepID=UPI001117FF16|nr:leucine-rich repeat domain-containing protein [Raoultibacter phocaeensis]